MVTLVLVLISGMASAKETLTVGVLWDTDSLGGAGWLPLAEAFTKLHPDVEIEYMFGTVLGDRPTDEASAKVITMVAGDAAPDLVMIAGQNVAQYAASGLILPLDSYLEKSNVNRGDFAPPAWRQTMWRGKKYAMTVQVDPNLAVVWNKDLFARSGLDEDRGPKTVAEYEEYFRKLTRIDTDGSATQLADIPWSIYGYSNAVYTWSWIFGGQFFEYETNTVTAARPNNVAAVTFLRDYYNRYAPAVNDSIIFPDGGRAMYFAVSGHLKWWLETFPNARLGIGLEPYKADTTDPNPSWIGGWAMGILQGCDNPDLAWEFLRFLTASEQGTEVFARPSGWIPAYLRSPVIEDYLGDPWMSVYLEIAQSARHMRPAMPAVGDYTALLEQALTEVFDGQKQPREALKYVEKQVQRKLDEVLAGLE